MTSRVKYLGELRTESEHILSGQKIISDAPKDNFGNGSAFSPTDQLANALATCILTTIGIVSRRDGMSDIDGAEAEVTKVMYNEPRRVGEIQIKIIFPPKNFSDKEKTIYERVSHSCPVSKSLHPELKQVVKFVWK